MDPVNTARVERRRLHFATIDDALAEVDRIVAAERSGQLEQLGNWTAGQIFGHVAAWIEYGYSGYPLGPPPWFVRWFLKRKLGAYLRDGLPAGVRMPRSPDGTFGTDRLSTDEGADRLRRAFSRLKQGKPAKYDSPAFGPMSMDDRVQLNLRHAELHLSFLNC